MSDETMTPETTIEFLKRCADDQDILFSSASVMPRNGFSEAIDAIQQARSLAIDEAVKVAKEVEAAWLELDDDGSEDGALACRKIVSRLEALKEAK